MAGEVVLREKVVSFLSELSPAARNMLIRKLEGSGSGDAVGEQMRVILEAARSFSGGRDSRPAETQPAAIDMKARIFAPFAVFMVDEKLVNKQRGWILRESIDTLWTFLCQEVLPEEFLEWREPRVSDDFTAPGALDKEVARLQALAFEKLVQRDRATQDEPKAHQRFLSRMGGETAYADFQDMVDMRGRLLALERLFTKLPTLSSGGDASDRLMIEPIQAYLSEMPGDRTWVAAGLCSRISTTATLARIATTLAGSQDAVDLRKSSGVPFIDIGLSMAERHIIRFQNQVRSDRANAQVTGEMRRFHEALRGLTTNLELENDSAWRARLSQLRRRFSEIIAGEIERILPVLRQALRVDEKSQPTDSDGAEALFQISVFATARLCRDSLAVNELLTRVTPSIDQMVELYARELPERLRRASGEYRSAALKAFDNLIAIAEHTNGEEYAAYLRRTRHNLLQPRSA
ncbi:hypothetical protein [Oryzibacter oryziterrae]|uniref:hypothetical protein n=1 Tax=Oryzibacter oryziterrae TaxID=2766474 RepID=UPI001F351F2C|nr:hypothetical protein [Oryzibacter oryziterrae]